MIARVCKRGHRITGRNVSWHTDHGKRRPRCRRCYNTNMRRLMRRRRKG